MYLPEQQSKRSKSRRKMEMDLWTLWWVFETFHLATQGKGNISSFFHAGAKGGKVLVTPHLQRKKLSVNQCKMNKQEGSKIK